MLPFCACTNSDSSFVVFMMKFEIDLASKKSKSLEPCLLVSHLWDGHIFVTWSTDLPTGALSEFNCTTACSISSYYAILQSHSSRCNFDKTGFGIRHNLLHYERLVFHPNSSAFTETRILRVRLYMCGLTMWKYVDCRATAVCCQRVERRCSMNLPS